MATDRPPLPEAFYEQCWQCRCVVPNGLVRRRVVNTGHSSGTLLGTGAAYARLRSYETVSLCGVCDDAMRRAEQARRGFIGRWFGIGVGTFLLSLSAIPSAIGFGVMVTLSRFRCVGRAVLVLYVLGMTVSMANLQPDRHPARVVIPWALVTGGLLGWQVWWSAESFLWPVSWLFRRRAPRVRIPSPGPERIAEHP